MKKRIICLYLALLLCAALAVPALAADNTGFVYDAADLLTPEEESALIRKLAAVSAKYEAQIVVVTSGTTNGPIDSYVDQVYDSTGFGYGQRRDGVLLLICMDVREYRILSNGYPGVAIDTGDIDRISDIIVDDLSAGDYAEAFDKFADECAYYLDGYINGFPFDFTGSLGISLAIGIVVGLIVVFVLKGQLTSVRKQHEADVYVKAGSMNLTASHDIFLYRNVTRTKKQTSNSSGSGGGGGARSRGGGSF